MATKMPGRGWVRIETPSNELHKEIEYESRVVRHTELVKRVGLAALLVGICYNGLVAQPNLSWTAQAGVLVDYLGQQHLHWWIFGGDFSQAVGWFLWSFTLLMTPVAFAIVIRAFPSVIKEIWYAVLWVFGRTTAKELPEPIPPRTNAEESPWDQEFGRPKERVVH
jgi:hypothetical protein